MSATTLLLRYNDPVGPTVPPCWSDGFHFEVGNPERARTVGSLWEEARRGAAAMREAQAAADGFIPGIGRQPLYFGRTSTERTPPATPGERAAGIPEGWWTR